MAKQTRRKISLALQGGGAHGAYTWGVLDRLAEEENLEIRNRGGGCEAGSSWLRAEKVVGEGVADPCVRLQGPHGQPRPGSVQPASS